MTTNQLCLVFVLLCLTAPVVVLTLILTGVDPGYEAEQPSFRYTNFGIIHGTREFQKQFQLNPATDDINHSHPTDIGTAPGKIPENVSPYPGDGVSQVTVVAKKKKK
uniref:Putative secreted protein n=1 Tax=Ixodes ricinus TaxID=34613 RepID=A0A0K8RCN7_IXORI